MSEPTDYSEAGDPIYRYKQREKPFEPASGGDHIDVITQHIEQHIGKSQWVFHELVSDLVHIDVHIVDPTPERNFFTLITSGMSDRAMNAPADASEFAFAELMVCLPPTWDLGDCNHQPAGSGPLADERNYWPIRWLKILARFPHEYDTWLGAGHTLPNGDPPAPFAPNTQFCCMMVMPSATAPKEFNDLRVDDRTIHFYALWPLYREEMDFKLKHAVNGLLDKFDRTLGSDASRAEIINIHRKNACRKRFWPFGG